MNDIFPAVDGTAAPQCLANTLSIHVFLLPDNNNNNNNNNNNKHNDEDERDNDVRRLARIAHNLNRYFHSLDYPWWSLPPEFGLYRIMDDKNDTICLRASCRYGPCVADEWRAIQAVLDFTATIEKDDNNNIIVECWDEDDGPVLLIQAADDLPTVLAEHSDTGGRYRSWIYRGQVYFLLASPDQELSMSQAWSLLLDENKSLTVASAAVQSIIATSSPGQHGDADQWHRTAVVVPTDLAGLCTNYPRLIHAAIEVEASSAEQQRPSVHRPPRPLVESSRQGRPQQQQQQQQLVWLPIRMGRTSYAVLRSMAEVGSNDDAAVSPGSNIQVAMGQVLARGIATLQNDQRNNTAADIDHQSAESSGGGTIRWSRAIWEKVDVDDDETMTTNGDDAMKLFQPFDATCSLVPLEIDSDAWMDVVTSSGETTTIQKDQEDGINAVHKGLTSFLTGDSSAAGVVGRSSSIHGGRALRILHAALQASSAAELAVRLDTEFDPFFSKNDYDDLAAAGDDNDGTEEGEDTSLRGLMRAMDGELGRNEHDGSPMQVMTNLLKSLGSGGPGPTRHLLNEMNQTAPNMTLDDHFD
jgi:hypothetical protein